MLEKTLLWHQLGHTNKEVAMGGAGHPAPFKRRAAKVLNQNSSGDPLLGRDGFPGGFN